MTGFAGAVQKAQVQLQRLGNRVVDNGVADQVRLDNITASLVGK